MVLASSPAASQVLIITAADKPFAKGDAPLGLFLRRFPPSGAAQALHGGNFWAVQDSTLASRTRVPFAFRDRIHPGPHRRTGGSWPPRTMS
jgi:hypothetical protein